FGAALGERDEVAGVAAADLQHAAARGRRRRQAQQRADDRQAVRVRLWENLAGIGKFIITCARGRHDLCLWCAVVIISGTCWSSTNACAILETADLAPAGRRHRHRGDRLRPDAREPGPTERAPRAVE